MSQDPYKIDNKAKLPKFSNRPGEGGDNTPRKGPRFSIYWIYAIIFAILIGFQLFGPLYSSSTQINQGQFEDMLKNGDIDKYTVVSNRNLVRLKVKPESLPKYEGDAPGKLGKT